MKEREKDSVTSTEVTPPSLLNSGHSLQFVLRVGLPFSAHH